MPRGAAVIRREGKRGASWAIKYRDASGRQVWEGLGREPAWNEARAQRELGVPLAAVERDRYRRPDRLTFAEFAERWRREYLPGRNLKPSTASDYLSILEGRLLPYFGAYELAALGPAEVDGYIAELRRRGSPRIRSGTTWGSCVSCSRSHSAGAS